MSSANLTGKPAALEIEAAIQMLRDSVSVYLDGGLVDTGVASTIIDATGLVGRDSRPVTVLREGAVSRSDLREVLGDLLEPDPVDPDESDAA